jgi:hypothetical protein
MKFGVKAFTLPGQESQLQLLLNDPLIVVTTNERYFCSKEGYLIVYVVFEDYREEGVLI